MLKLQIFSHDRSIHKSISGISAYYLPPENEPCLKFTWDSSSGTEKGGKCLALNYSPEKTYSEERWNPKTTRLSRRRRRKLELRKYKIIAKVKHKREAGFGYQIKSIKVSLSPGFSFLSLFLQQCLAAALRKIKTDAPEPWRWTLDKTKGRRRWPKQKCKKENEKENP